MIRVFTVDDQVEIIKNLSLFFSESDSLHLVGQAQSGEECLRLFDKFQTDVILMDIDMETPKAGIKTAKEILREKPNPKIIFLTAHANQANLKDAISLGCSFIDKSIRIPRIIEIIEEVFFLDQLIVET